MFHLRLCKALSYAGVVSATKAKPDVYTEDEAVAERALASGYFVLVSGPAAATPEDSTNEDPTAESGEVPDYKALARQTKAELIAYAQLHGIGVADCKTKADILQAISAAYGGSYAMMELQQED